MIDANCLPQRKNSLSNDCALNNLPLIFNPLLLEQSPLNRQENLHLPLFLLYLLPLPHGHLSQTAPLKLVQLLLVALLCPRDRRVLIWMLLQKVLTARIVALFLFPHQYSPLLLLDKHLCFFQSISILSQLSYLSLDVVPYEVTESFLICAHVRIGSLLLSLLSQNKHCSNSKTTARVRTNLHKQAFWLPDCGLGRGRFIFRMRQFRGPSLPRVNTHFSLVLKLINEIFVWNVALSVDQASLVTFASRLKFYVDSDGAFSLIGIDFQHRWCHCFNFDSHLGFISRQINYLWAFGDHFVQKDLKLSQLSVHLLPLVTLCELWIVGCF